MAVTSYGYAGTIVPGQIWSRFQWGLGRRYWVYNQDAVRVTPKAGGTREVNVSAGWFGAYGVINNNDSVASVQLPVVASGTGYFFIYARYNWQGTPATTFTYTSAGTSLPTAVGTRNTDFGTIDDQPLALVSLAAGSSIPAVVADLRIIGTEGGPLVAADPMVLSYLAYAGAEVLVGLGTTPTRWNRVLNAAGTGHVWAAAPDPFRTAKLPVASSAQVVTHQSGWSGLADGNQAWRDGNTVTVYQLLRRWVSGGVITPGGGGGVGNSLLGQMAAEYRPSKTVPVSARYVATNGGDYQAQVLIFPTGAVQLASLTEGYPLRTHGTDYSLEFSTTYVQKG